MGESMGLRLLWSGSGGADDKACEILLVACAKLLVCFDTRISLSFGGKQSLVDQADLSCLLSLILDLANAFASTG